MKTEVQADSFYAAQCKVRDKIIFHKTEEKPNSQQSPTDDKFKWFVDAMEGAMGGPFKK
jgi:hypothetical protein